MWRNFKINNELNRTDINDIRTKTDRGVSGESSGNEDCFIPALEYLIYEFILK